MHYMIAAYLKPGVEDQLSKHYDQFNEHLGASAGNLVIAGLLRDQEGRRAGYMAIVDGETIAGARSWLEESPLYQAGLYERVEVLEYQIEVGRLG